MQSESASASQPQYRLPVNPRRRKVKPEERKRVVRACNSCNVKRVKCSGEQPCQRCRTVSRECEYPVPESDKSLLKSEVDSLRKRCAALEQSLQAAAPDDAADILSRLDCGESATRTSPTFASVPPETDEAESMEGCLLFDPEGTVRYLGETSGATFLDHLKHFMLTLIPLTFQPNSGDGSSFVASIGHYQTFDSRPLPNPDVDPLWLPSRTEMTLMLTELRYDLQDGNGDFPSGGIFWWGDLNSLPASTTSSASLNAVTTEETFRFLAFYHICFALASSVGHTSFRHSEQHTGEAYFKRARMLIGNPLDTVRFTLSDVPVLALMGFYLIEVNRRDAAYIYISLAIHIAVIHGAFRSCRDEASKRTFWTLYILDRWLSLLMGRPHTIADEAIRLPLPSDVPSMPPSAGLRAHVELSRISGYIVCETFKIAPRIYKSGYQTNNINKALGMLQAWQSQLPSALQMPGDLSHPDPSCCILHMAYNQLIVLTTRPIFFAAVKQVVAQRFVRGFSLDEQYSQDHHIQACSQAAQRNVLLAQHIIALSRRLLQAGLHFVFNAAVILLLNRILNCMQDVRSDGPNSPTLRGQDPYAPGINAAIQIFEEEARTGTNYPRDCFKVLQDLKALSDRYLMLQCKAELPHVNVAGHTQNISQVQYDNNYAAGIQASHPTVNKGDGVYQEVVTWVQNDGLELHKSLYI